MKINNLSLPHPVLGIGDDVKGNFDISCEVSLSSEKAILSVSYEITNDTINGMIEAEEAIVNAEIHCPKTLYRKSFGIKEDKHDLKIETAYLRGMVYVNFYIVSLTDNENYTIANSNADYDGYVFQLKKGDVLAWGGSIKFPALKDWRALKAADSFLVIEKYNADEGPAKISLSHEKIIVELSKTDYKRYEYYSQRKGLFPIYHSSIVLPVLIYTLTKMKENPGEYEERGWFEVLNFRKNEEEELRNFDWNSTEQIPTISQCLLGNPVGRMLKATDGLMKMAQEGE